MTTPKYGSGDATFQAAGREEGIRALVDAFYDTMERDYARIFSWHTGDRDEMRDKLARFLCGWMGGPRLYQEKYGAISIPGVHAHLDVDASAKNDWLACMTEALTEMNYPNELKTYLIEQLSIPAEHIRRTVAPNSLEE